VRARVFLPGPLGGLARFACCARKRARRVWSPRFAQRPGSARPRTPLAPYCRPSWAHYRRVRAAGLALARTQNGPRTQKGSGAFFRLDDSSAARSRHGSREESFGTESARSRAIAGSGLAVRPGMVGAEGTPQHRASSYRNDEPAIDATGRASDLEDAHRLHGAPLEPGEKPPHPDGSGGFVFPAAKSKGRCRPCPVTD